MEPSDRTKKLLSIFMRRLTNLSANNRSLYLPRLSSDQFLDLHSLSQLNGENSFSLIEALMGQKRKNICPVIDTRIEAVATSSNKLKKLKRLGDFIFEERGSYDLHVAWPFLHGKFSDGSLARAPLLFFPVTLEIIQDQWMLVPRKETDPSINKSLLLAYSFFNQLKLSEELIEETFEDFPHDPTAFRTELYKILQAAKMEINFNPAHYYQNELTTFQSFTKEELTENYGLGELKLFPEAVLGIFPQAGSSLVPDYIHLLEENSFEDLENFFTKSETLNQGVTNFIPLVKEDKVYSIFPTDSWQENALKAVKLGNSVVVEGPPGTGKSQLICNLISDNIANGKRVLVVSQKRAALDVVYSRLAEKSLGEFVTLVHDYKNDRKAIFEKLARQINRVDEYKTRNISLDAIQLDRTFLKASKLIDQLSDELEHFRTALFDESDCGVSIKQLYLQSDPHQPSVNLKQEYHFFKFHELDSFQRIVKRYTQLASTLEDPDHPWKKRKPFSSFAAADLKRITATLEDICNRTQVAFEEAKKTFSASCDWEDIIALIERKNELEEIKKSLTTEHRYVYFKGMLPVADQEGSSLWLSNVERMMNDCFLDTGPESSVPAIQLGAFQKALHRSMRARRSLWGLIRWQLFSKDKVLITRALVANQLKNDKQGFRELEKRLDNRLNLEHNFSKLRNAGWLQNIPESTHQQQIQEWCFDQQTALKAKLIYSSIRPLKNFIDPSKLDFESFSASFQNLVEWLSTLQHKLSEWQVYITPAQINLLTVTSGLKEKLINSLKEDFERLCEFDLIQETLTSNERSIIHKIHELTQSWNHEQFQKTFLNSLSLAWIDHIEQKHPELRIASSGKIRSIEDDLQHQVNIKENVSGEILLLRARERITENLEFNRLNNRVSYRDLLHQATKKKKIWPLRKVIAEFEEEVFKLTPCWLASPESVSALFPMREMFDLVIFDEASQCFAERGIPALYRGKQAVIAGDSKQLRPGDFYLARWQDDDFDEPDAEVDSLLELAGRYLMKLQLNGHYRSRSWQLIQFSNEHFYSGKLELLPHFETVRDHTSPIDYIKVEGKWDNNSNEEEANEVIRQVQKIWNTEVSKKIGIVTFNATQQSLILDLVDSQLGGYRVTPENLFVKNIENVQGDERDIIIFSIGYAPDKKGRMNVQFGSLNQEGGENRLNVAVTRAREKVIVVTSVLPSQLLVEETKNQGPRLLKDYLTYALNVSQGKDVTERSLKQTSRQQEELRFMLNVADSNPEVTYSYDYPFADAVMFKNQKAVSLVLTDDNSYFQSLSSKAAHAQIPQLLEKKAWPFLRVYSRNFWADKKRFFREIESLVS